MAARRKPTAKKKRARRGSRGASAPKKKAKKRVVTPIRAPKKRAKRPIQKSKRSTQAPTIPKRRVKKKPQRQVKKKQKVVKPTSAQRAAITRTLRAFASLPKPRAYTRESVKVIYNAKRKAFIDTLTRAGFSSISIRTQVGWVSRRRFILRDEIARIRMEVLGTTLLHGSDPDQRRILELMIRERDKRYLEFITQMEELNLPQTEIVNEWFSPKVQTT